MSKSPEHKRLKLDPSTSPSPTPERDLVNPSNAEEITALSKEDVARLSIASMDEDGEDHCVICLQYIRDRTVLPCAHDRMCFECILVWTAQSRKCPLCNAPIGPFLIHNMRSKYDYQKRYLPPLRTSPPPIVTPLPPSRGGNSARNRGRSWTARWGTRSRRRSASQERQVNEDELELAVEQRKWIYRHRLYAKHVASNPYTRYRPAPTPAQIVGSPDLISRATIFVRRELRVWVNLDVEFLTTFILSLMKTLDLRSESAVKLLAEFLDMDTPYHVGVPSESTGRFSNAEQFAHELYSYLRSPFRELATYDSVVQYDVPEHIAPAPSQYSNEIRRWGPRSPTLAQTSTNRRRHSSPSPLSHSPRDAYSRSQSSHDSDSSEGDVLHHSPRILRSVLPYPQSAKSAEPDYRGHEEEVDRNSKGKEKETEYPRTDISRRDDDGADQIQRHLNISSQPGSRHTQKSGKRRRHRSSPGRSSHPLRRGEAHEVADYQGPAKAASSPKISHRVNSPEKRSLDPPSHVDDPNLRNSGETVAVKSEKTWGISIRGQAKLLKHTRTSSGERNSQRSPPGSSKDRYSQDGTSILNVRHTHLGRASATRDILPNTALAINSDAGCVIRETRRGANVLEPENQVAKAATYAVQSDEEAPGAYLASRHIDHVPASPSHSLQARHRTVPEIMARTRAKIAKLRGQPSVGGVASATEPGEGTQVSPSQRERLLERLEEEKRQAFSQPGDGAPVYRSVYDGSKHDASATSEIETLRITKQEDGRTSESADSKQAETKLRAQALMRVRLAAEKRRFEEQQTTSREEALRTKLLSRRA